MKGTITSILSRTAIMLLAIMLASQTAWADNIEITNANFTDYFDYDEEFDMQIGNSSATIVSNVGGYFLKEAVAEGATLDFKGDFTPPTDGKNPRVFINKRVNITSSDKSAVFKSGDTGLYWCFGVVEGGDNAEVKNLQFDNCWVFIHGASYVTFDGIDLQVHDANIGSGYGAFSIATLEDGGPLSEYATLKNSNFNFTNNGISAIVVVGRGGSHATIDNNTVEVGTNVGNMLSSTVYLGKGDQPEFVTYSNNVITREGASTATSFAIAIIGAGNVVENNKIHYAGAAITTGYGSTLNDNTPNIYRNNTITGGGSMGTNTYGVVENNHVSGQLSLAREVTAICNTASVLSVSYGESIIQGNTVYGEAKFNTSALDVLFTGNLVMRGLSLNVNAGLDTITGNAIFSSDEYAIKKVRASKNNRIEYNWLVAAEKRGDEAVDPTIGTENTIQNNISDATVITDETTTLTATENGAFYVVPANTAVTIPGDLTVAGSAGQRVNIILAEGATLTINGKLAASGKTVGIYAMTNDETTGSVAMNEIDYQELFVSSGIVTVDGVVYSGHYGEPGSVEEVTNYDLWLAGTQVTSANADDLSVIEGVTGSAQYDADNNTLTLSGATITGGYGNDNCGGAIVYNGDNDFHLDVSGSNSITGDTRLEQSAGILFADPDNFYNGKTYNVDINIAEGALLTVNAGKAEGIYYPTSFGIAVASLGEVTITNAGTLNANGGSGTYSYGISASRNITFNGTGTINATAIGGSYYNAGIAACGVVINDGDITAVGGNVENSYGITTEGGEWCGLGNININGGTVLATGWTKALDKAPVLASGMAAKGSTTTDGAGAVRYVADDNANYKWVTTFPYQGTTYAVELTPEYKSVPPIYAGCPNYLTLKVENTGEAASSDAEARVYADEVLVWEGEVGDLPAGEAKTLEVVDPTIRPVTENTIIGNGNKNVVYKVVVEEAGEVGVEEEFPFVVLYNGNLGKEYAYPSLNPVQRTFSFKGDVQVLVDEEYSTAAKTSREDAFAVDLAGGSVHKALLYVSYNWDKTTEGDFNNWTTTFNGNAISPLANYRDQGNLGYYGGYGYGLVVYDVTDFVVDGNNTFAFEKPAGNVAVYPSSLIVMVENPLSGITKDVYIVEEADLLSTQYNQHEDAIYASSFQGVAEGEDATLYVFAANAQSGEGDLEINGNLQTDVWNGTSNSLEVYETSVETGDISIQFKATGSTILALHQMVVVSKTSTGIVSVDNGLAIDDCFDLQGRRINKPQKGVTIIRTSDGKTRKVMVK